MSPFERSAPEVRTAALLITAAACWGLGTVVSKRAIEEFPPITLLAVQLGASLATLAAAMRVRGLPLRGHPTPPILARLGLLNPGLAYALGLVGLTGITASLSVLLWAAEPVLILLLATAVLGERPTPRFLALSALALGGMVLVLYEPGTAGSVVGIAFTLAGVACCGIYTVLARRALADHGEASTMPVVMAQQAHALVLAVALLGALALAGGPVVPVAVTPLGIGSALLSGVIYFGAAYWAYLGALGRVTAVRAAASFYLIPVFGVAGGISLLGEALSPLQWLGSALVVIAVARILVERGGSVPGKRSMEAAVRPRSA